MKLWGFLRKQNTNTNSLDYIQKCKYFCIYTVYTHIHTKTIDILFWTTDNSSINKLTVILHTFTPQSLSATTFPATIYCMMRINPTYSCIARTKFYFSHNKLLSIASIYTRTKYIKTWAVKNVFVSWFFLPCCCSNMLMRNIKKFQ